MLKPTSRLKLSGKLEPTATITRRRYHHSNDVVMLRDLMVTNARAFYTPHAAAGASGTRHSPRTHNSGRDVLAKFERIAPRGREGVSGYRADEATRVFAVIPGRCAASNPESRDSGSGPSDHPGMTMEQWTALHRPPPHFRDFLPRSCRWPAPRPCASLLPNRLKKPTDQGETRDTKGNEGACVGRSDRPAFGGRAGDGSGKNYSVVGQGLL